MCFTAVYFLSDLILKSVCRVCIDGLEVIFRYEGLYFNFVVLSRKNDYRIFFIHFVIIASLLVVLYGLESWSLTVREEHRLSVFENCPKRTLCQRWRKLNNEELNDSYCSPNNDWMIKWSRMRSAGHVMLMGRG